MAARVDPDQLQPGTLVDGWRVVRRMDGGSYGVVYEVEKGGQSFALKMARHSARSGDQLKTDARLERERACLHQLHHPNIVRAWASGRWQDPRTGLLYIVMDLIDGCTLAEWVESTHPTPHEVVVLFEKLFSALEHMEKCHLSHRDLSLRNIMVRKADGEPFIIDFSVADYAGAEELTEGPLPPGTPRNRSPEATRFWRENRLNTLARYPFKVSDDIFALGADLYDVLTNPTPTKSQKRVPLGSEVLAPPSPFLATQGRVPERLSAFAMTLIDPEPGKRPTAKEGRRVFTDMRQQNDPAWHTPFHSPAAQVPPAPEPAPGMEAGAPRVAAKVPVPRRGWGWPAWGGALVLLVLVGVGALSLRARAWREPASPPLPAPRAEKPTSPAPRLPSQPPTPQEARPTVNPPENALTPTAVSPSSPPPAEVPLRRRKLSQRERCALAVGTLTWIQLGCPSIQVSPEPDERCPPEAIKVMDEVLDWDDSGKTMWRIIVDVKKGGEEGKTAVFTDGPVQGAVSEGYGRAPAGMLLDGHLWTKGERIQGRYFRAHVPGKGTLPVCVQLKALYHGPGLPKEEGSKPGAAVGDQVTNAVAIKRYE